MKMNVLKTAVLLGLSSLFMFSCTEKQEGPESGAVEVTGVAILNAGEDGATRADGVLSGDTFTIEVSPLSNLASAKLEITAPSGVTTTPANGAVVDFEANAEQSLVAYKGTEVKNYKIKVVKSELADELVVKSFEVTGVYAPQTKIDHAAKTITISFSNVTGTTATLSDFVFNPATATVKASVPEMTEEGTMVIDFSDDTEKSITVQNGSEEKKYVITAEISKAGFDPATAKVAMDQFLGSGLNATLGTSNTRGAFFDGKYMFFACREGGNNIYYYDIEDATKEMKSLDMGEGIVSGGSWAISDVRVAENGGIYVCSMAMAKDGLFNVYYWSDVNAKPVKMLSYAVEDPVSPATAVRLGDALSIIGDPQTDGYIATSNFPSGNNKQAQFYLWKVTDGKVADTPQIVDYVDQFTGASADDKSIGQYGRINEIPGDSEHFIATGANAGMLILNSDMTEVEFELVREVPIQGRAMDPHFFEYNSIRYLAYTVNREWAANDAFVEIVALTEGNSYYEGVKALADKSIDDIRVYKEQITTTATKGAAWISACSNAKVVNDKVYVFGYVCEYGAKVVEFGK